jgi:L,D-peptidoglycan transpeptidase YkuD (ErfK/YbiS/YcfS/YnhG family)
MNLILLSCCLLAALPSLATAQSHSTAASALRHSTQLIVVTTSNWDAVSGRLQRYQRSAPAQPWHTISDPITIVVGKAGMGWGIGIDPLTAARTPGDPIKREGDHKSPAGIFRFGTSFGYAPHAPNGWKMPYLALTPAIDCVDDSHSRFYNRLMDFSTIEPDWNSAESMRDAGQSYVWGIVIDHNTDHPIPEGGSCVFMHIWAGPGVGTVGCTAMPQQQLESILAWLNPDAHPLLIQMPLRSYQQIQHSLHLPTPPTD